jgi:hypothetical protein
MKKGMVLGLGVLFVAAALWAADTVQPLDVKLGLWETTFTTETSGMPPIPPEMMSKMTPEQKARMEAAMAARQGQGPHTQTRKSCVTKEDLNKAIWDRDKEDPDCKKTIVTSTSHKVEAKLECTKDGGKQSGTLSIEAEDSTNVKGATQMVMTGGGHTMTMNSHFTSKWLGPACGTVK